MSSLRRPKRLARRHVWTAPLALAMLAATGLVAALLGTGTWRVMSWLTLSIPLAVVARHALMRR